MTDYTYPSVYFAYFFFFIVASLALYFCFRYRDGYWGKDSEDVKYRMLEDDENGGENGREQRQ